MRQEEEAQARERSWIRVTDGETVPFTFESRTKARHQSSRQHQLHQIVVRVEGWREIKPVSVDRVGTFFRNVAAVRPSSSFTDLPPVRLVFSVTLEAGARKLITVRSALEVENKIIKCPRVLMADKLQYDDSWQEIPKMDQALSKNSQKNSCR